MLRETLGTEQCEGRVSTHITPPLLRTDVPELPSASPATPPCPAYSQACTQSAGIADPVFPS